MGAQLPYNTSSNLKPNRAVIRHIEGLRVKTLKFSKFYPKHSSVMIALNANSCNEIDCLMLIYHLSIWKFNFLPFVLYTWWQNDALWRLRQFSDNSKCDHMLFRQCQKSFFRGKVKTIQNVQGGWGGWPTGNGKKLSSCQAQLGQATCLAVA